MWCRRQKTGPSSSQQMSSSHPTRHKSDEKYTENLSIHIFNARVNVPRTRWLRARSVTWGTTGARRVSTSSWATAAWQVRNKMPTINVDMWKTHRKKTFHLFSSWDCHFPDDNNQSFQFRLVTTTMNNAALENPGCSLFLKICQRNIFSEFKPFESNQRTWLTYCKPKHRWDLRKG